MLFETPADKTDTDLNDPYYRIVLGVPQHLFFLVYKLSARGQFIHSKCMQ
jgi:hypothetical protein